MSGSSILDGVIHATRRPVATLVSTGGGSGGCWAIYCSPDPREAVAAHLLEEVRQRPATSEANMEDLLPRLQGYTCDCKHRRFPHLAYRHWRLDETALEQDVAKKRGAYHQTGPRDQPRMG